MSLLTRGRSNRFLAVVIVVGLALLAVGTGFLKSVHAHVRDDRLRGHLTRGVAYAASGDLERAAAEYRAALQLRRDDPAAGRALALTLLELGQLPEADSYLRDLVRRDPTDGPLNRGLARIHVARGRDAAARAAYRRAISGEWPGDGIAAKIETRFEFIDYLVRIGAQQEVLPELLQLRAQLPPRHVAAARRTAQMLADRGALDLAIETLGTPAMTAPRDVDLLAQLGELQSRAGRLAEARATLARAAGIDSRRDILDRLAVVDRVLAMDPTLPRLRLVARTARARLVLDAVIAQTNGCPNESAELALMRREAAGRVRRPIGSDAERAEAELALAERIWTTASACSRASADARALTQILERVAASSEPWH